MEKGVVTCGHARTDNRNVGTHLCGRMLCHGVSRETQGKRHTCIKTTPRRSLTQPPGILGDQAPNNGALLICVVCACVCVECQRRDMSGRRRRPRHQRDAVQSQEDGEASQKLETLRLQAKDLESRHDAVLKRLQELDWLHARCADLARCNWRTAALTTMPPCPCAECMHCGAG